VGALKCKTYRKRQKLIAESNNQDTIFDVEKGYKGRLSLKKCKTSGVAQVVEHLPSQCEALSSNPTTTKKIF
jgi:hypothetical protein